MTIELKKEDIQAVPQSPIKVLYDNEIIGEYYADILIYDKVIIEIKASKVLTVEQKAQLF